MMKPITIQGRETTQADIEFVRRFITEHPSWNRTQISQELCRLWDWRSENGQLKDMACRSFLRKLVAMAEITLPPPQGGWANGRSRPQQLSLSWGTEMLSIEAPLRALLPVRIESVRQDEDLALFKALLAHHHYLGFNRTVGENLKYLVFDCYDRPLACFLFGSAAWRCADRDRFIDWNDRQRAKQLHLITNNTRFLILPGVRVPHLASHLLGRIVKRVSSDWEAKYGHPIVLLETFVDQNRFWGTCYQASNWIRVGQTRGRSRNDRYTRLQVPVKAIYIYPLIRDFREALIR